MRKHSKTIRIKLFASVGVCACCCSTPHAEGLPEPGLVMYGTVVNTYGGGNARVTSGRLIWTIQSPSGGGAAITVTNDLANINNQFSYVLRLPFESVVGSATLSPNVLQLTTSSTTYLRTAIKLTVGGTAYPVTISPPALGNFSFNSASRGRTERVDLTVSAFGIGPVVTNVTFGASKLLAARLLQALAAPPPC